jgi:ERCC4-related helicase
MQLRDYQQDITEQIRDELRKGNSRPILSLPTGAGKTVSFAHICHLTQQKGKRVLIAAHRIEIIEQARNTLSRFLPNLNGIHFSMVQAMQRNARHIPPHDLLICDECHIGNFRNVLLSPLISKHVIGVTATPISASNKTPLRETFTNVIAPVQINELIEKRYLAEPIYHVAKMDESELIKVNGEFSASSQRKALKSVFDNLSEAIQNRVGKTIVFCPDIETTVTMANQYGAMFVHSKQTAAARNITVQAYLKSYDNVIFNCGILTAGFDCPEIQTVIVYRATTSLPLWLQMCGRGSRPAYPEFHIWDLGNNVRRLGSWHMDRDWSRLFYSQGLKKTEQGAPYKSCPKCEALCNASAKFCDVCKAPFPEPERIELSGEIETIRYGEIPKHLDKPVSTMTLPELIERAQIGSGRFQRPYNPDWIARILAERGDTKGLYQFAREKGYKSGWVSIKLRQFSKR